MKNPKTTMTEKFSNTDAVLAAQRRAAVNLVPTAEELAQYAEQDKRSALDNAFLRNVARALAHDAADTLAPAAGKPISDATRDRLAADFYRALAANLPPLRNLVSA
ncbi:hypothetical protein [Burkholderia pseudomallei]